MIADSAVTTLTAVTTAPKDEAGKGGTPCFASR
ncbi:MAG: hypothetical protein JWN62_2370 [Acidimicrobiales bacterium]|nr:hypothetical protein [Acidimicrobiales bacterium]